MNKQTDICFCVLANGYSYIFTSALSNSRL